MTDKEIIDKLIEELMKPHFDLYEKALAIKAIFDKEKK